MGKINFIKGQRPRAKSSFDGVYNDGGMTDLFEDYQSIPTKIQKILNKYSDESGSIDDLSGALKEVEANGYTFEYDMDGVAYALRPKNVALFNVKGYEDMKAKNGLYVSKKAKFNNGGQTNEEQNRAMIFSQAKEVSHHVSELNEIMTKQPDIDAWVIAKMQDVTTGLSDITHYLDGRVGFRLGADDVSERMKEMLRDGGEIILGGGSMASVQDSILANGAKLKSGKLSLSKLRSMIEEYNSEGRNFELRGAYNQLELWGNDYRLEAGSKEDIYRALIRYRFNPKYANGAELPDMDSMTDEEIITFANTLSYYDRMDEGIEEEFTDVEDAKEYLRMMAESE